MKIPVKYGNKEEIQGVCTSSEDSINCNYMPNRKPGKIMPRGNVSEPIEGIRSWYDNIKKYACLSEIYRKKPNSCTFAEMVYLQIFS